MGPIHEFFHALAVSATDNIFESIEYYHPNPPIYHWGINWIEVHPGTGWIVTLAPTLITIILCAVIISSKHRFLLYPLWWVTSFYEVVSARVFIFFPDLSTPTDDWNKASTLLHMNLKPIASIVIVIHLIFYSVIIYKFYKHKEHRGVNLSPSSHPISRILNALMLKDDKVDQFLRETETLIKKGKKHERT